MTDPASPLDDYRQRWPDLTDEARVRKIAADLIDQLGISAPPVPMHMVASALDIASVTEVPGLLQAGCLIVGPRGGEVRLRAEDSSARKRFTLGHECGHTFHAGFEVETQFRCTPQTSAPSTSLSLEALCDVAASELLLPRRLLAAEIEPAEPLSRSLAEDLASRFEASLVASALAAVDASPSPAALLVFEQRQKPTERGTTAHAKLRLVWSHRSGTWPFFRQWKSVDEDDLFDRAFLGELISASGSTVRSPATHPIRADVYAWRADYSNQGVLTPRVLALLSRPIRRETQA